MTFGINSEDVHTTHISWWYFNSKEDTFFLIMEFNFLVRKCPHMKFILVHNNWFPLLQ